MSRAGAEERCGSGVVDVFEALCTLRSSCNSSALILLGALSSRAITWSRTIVGSSVSINSPGLTCAVPGAPSHVPMACSGLAALPL
eukprot:scaffold100959_cov29-Tisochrysis_lutea.AAC.2